MLTKAVGQDLPSLAHVRWTLTVTSRNACCTNCLVEGTIAHSVKDLLEIRMAYQLASVIADTSSPAPCQAVCYLNDQGTDFAGGTFRFRDGQPKSVAPVAGVSCQAREWHLENLVLLSSKSPVLLLRTYYTINVSLFQEQF